MTEREAYVAFNLADHIGFSTVEELSARAGGVVAAWEAFPKKISRTGAEIDWSREFSLAKKYGVSIVTPADADYPRQLKAAPGRPLALYVKGDVKALSKPAIALIGTRRATAYGRGVANRLGYDLAQAGWSVVSGLALGIDGEAHRGALTAGGVTVGVLGSALDCFYPEENRLLAREMAEKGGAVVSEFPFGHPPDRETFPIRNHVVAALVNGVVAVECPLKSGTLITTGIAADLGRTVMAVPGRVNDRMSTGCLQLLRDGALMVRNADDVLEAMSELLPRPAKPATTTIAEQPPARDAETPRYSVEEAMVMTQVDECGISIEELVRQTKLSVSRVNSLVMQLRLKGFLKFLPGNRVAVPARR